VRLRPALWHDRGLAAGDVHAANRQPRRRAGNRTGREPPCELRTAGRRRRGRDPESGRLGLQASRGRRGVCAGTEHHVGLLEAAARGLVDDGWYKSGDVAWADEEGYLFVVDRAKDMIISGGENIYTTEVENAVFRHPAVLEVAVFGIPHTSYGEVVHAEVVTK